MTSMLLSGMGHVRICSTFPGSAVMPPSVTTCPRYKTLFRKRKHFFGLSFSPAWASRSNTVSAAPILPCGHHDNHIIKVNQADFPMKTLQDKFHQSGKCTWRIAEPERHDIPFIQAARSYKCCFFLGACIHGHLPVTRGNSSVENHLEPLKAESESPTLGKGKASLTVAAFN